MTAPTASIVIPTEGRPDYLRVTLASVVPQAERAVGRGAGRRLAPTTPPRPRVARRFGARLVPAAGAGTLNASRNAGARGRPRRPDRVDRRRRRGSAGWLDGAAARRRRRARPRRLRRADPGPAGGLGPARLRARAAAHHHASTSAPRTATWRWCGGRTWPCAAARWTGSAASTRRCAGRGDEEDWERRYTAAGGRIRYLAAAGLDHRRSAADSTLRRLSRAAYGHGRAGRRYDVRKGEAPSLAAELRTLLGCVWHIFRRRCANGIVLTAQAAGRLRESLSGPR